MAIGQYTDKDIVVDFEGYDLNKMSGIHATFEQNGVVVDIADVIIHDSTRLIIPLRQQHTGKFKSDMPVDFQVNYFDEHGMRKKTDVISIEVKKNLLRRIIENV